MHRAVVVAALFLVGLALGGDAVAKDSDKPILEGELGEQLDEAVRDAGGRDFWGSVLVAREGKVLLAKGYGKADYATTPNTPRTLHELASASKQVTAAAILHLQQRKKLKVTDTLDKFFKDVPGDRKEIQLHHLLTHTSGLSNKLGVPYNSTKPRQRYVEEMLAEDLSAKPGERFEYSNVGYALLAAVVEEVTNKPFEAYCERHLFKPARCSDTGFINDRDLIKTKRASVRRSERDPRGQWTAASWHWGWGYRGMGGVVTTVLDLLRWDRALRGDKILDDESKAQLYRPFKAGYAYGWKVETTERGTRKAHHSGGVAGYGVNIVRYLEEDVAIFVLSNDGQAAFAVTGAIEKLLFEPVEIRAELSWKGHDVPYQGYLGISEGLSWKARKKGKDLLLTLAQGKQAVLELRAPKTYGGLFVSALEQAITAREADDEGGSAAIEARLYVSAFRGAKQVRLGEGLACEIQAEYRYQDERGEKGVDKRVLFVLKDTKNGGWPIMALMNVAAAREMLAAIRKAAK